MHCLGLILSVWLGSLFGAAPEADILFAGDAMMHQAQINAARRSDGTYNYSECFESLKPIISGADFAVVNLETPCSRSYYSGYPCFNAPASYPEALKNAGFDLMLTANNHCLDRHDRGLIETLSTLDSLKISHTGTFENTAERNRQVPLVRDIKGFSVAFLNYTYGTNGIRLTTDAVVDYIDRDKIRLDIDAARASGAELVCICPHWGNEYQLLPSAQQKQLAQYILDCGADMIIGCHPHVIQPMEIVKCANGHNAVIVYSLGNFISNMKTRDTRGGAIVRVHIKRNSEGKAEIENAAYSLVFTIPAGTEKNFRVVMANLDSIPSQWKTNCKEFVNSAKSIFNKHNKSVKEDKSILEPKRRPPLLTLEQTLAKPIWNENK
ncbi:MAG: CapA family protein [Muribaculum sp.]|nr:CapA family protein [Muribaculaceae bacterium]MCM1081366.1 CapA family protein [Muribaculum sp.]